MDKFYHSVYLDRERCGGCFTCLKRCPTQAIRIKDKKASIIPEFCIDCGECVRHCPHHAKRVHRDRFEEVREEFHYLVALPAPSLYSQFNHMEDTNIILTAILLSGFDDVFEVSVGAEIVSEASRAYVEEHTEGWPFISTACPTIERLIRVRYPDLIPHLLPILPPMEVAARLAREEAMEKTGLPGDEIGIIFISPCPSKVAFVNAPMGLLKSNVDRVIGIKDYYPILLNYMNEADVNRQLLSRSGSLGRGWAVSGGEALGLLSHEYLAADGIENVLRVLEDLEDEKFEPGLSFVELNACSPGCVGGVLTVENAYMAKAKTMRMNLHENFTGSDRAGRNAQTDATAWSEPVTYEPVFRLGDTISESMDNMEKIDQILEALPGMDCGCCGAPTCRALANDIVTARENVCIEDCIFLDLREKKVKTEDS